MKTIEKAATKSRVKAKQADSPTTNSVCPESVEGLITTIGAITKPRKEKMQPSDHSDLNYIGLEHVESETTRLLGSISATAMRSAANRYYQNDVLYSRLRPYLNKVHLASDAGLCSSEFIVFPENDNIASDFLRYRLNANDFVSFANSLDAGDRPRVNFEQISAFKFWCPPLLTQHRIVAEIEEKLSRLDAAQSALLRAQANLKRYRASVLQMACDQALLSAPLESFGKHVVHIESGKSFKCEERPPKDHEIGVAKVSAVTWGEYDEQQTKTCKNESRIEERYLIKPGDFLFTRANTIELIGACVIAKQVSLHIMLSDKILRFHFADNLDKRWALLWLKSHFGRKEIERLSTGNQESMRNIGQERIRQIQIAVPSLETQSEIISEVERRLSVIDRTEQALRTQLERAKRLRQSILQQAFSPTENY